MFHYKEISFKCLSKSSELCNLNFTLLCINSVFITVFGCLFCCQNLPDFITILVYPSLLILQLDLLVSEFLVSRYLVSYFFVFDVGKAVTYVKTTIVMRRRFAMRFKMTEAEYSGLSVKSFNCSGSVTERRRS